MSGASNSPQSEMTRPTPPLKEVKAWAAFDGEHLLPKTVRTTRRESIESAVVGGGFWRAYRAAGYTVRKVLVSAREG